VIHVQSGIIFEGKKNQISCLYQQISEQMGLPKGWSGNEKKIHIFRMDFQHPFYQ
jgi:hypothetical protein